MHNQTSFPKSYYQFRLTKTLLSEFHAINQSIRRMMIPFCARTDLWLITILVLTIFIRCQGHQLNADSSDHAGDSSADDVAGKRWALLVAGSNTYENYRHQADICHAYQILRKGGLKEENIVVFMYDDIAFNPENPRPGVIINKPDGDDVYQGVPKDYTGKYTNSENFYAVLLGNKSALTGGSGKVLDSGPNDFIFVYYADHGGPGAIGMPNYDIVYAEDLVEALKRKHAAKGFKRMVIYMEACESGSMFEGLLPENINIYATTSANAEESSFATYCSKVGDAPPEFGTCLGDLYSISWMEDSDKHDMSKETLEQQYRVVRRRTAYGDVHCPGSHVMQYGSRNYTGDKMATYIGTNPANDNYTTIAADDDSSIAMPSNTISQLEASLLPLKHKIRKAKVGSRERLEAEKKLQLELSERKHVDNTIKRIANILFGSENSPTILKMVRPAGIALVDDWKCFKMLARAYAKHCGPVSEYGRKYFRVLANMCNAGVSLEQMEDALAVTCPLKKNS